MLPAISAAAVTATALPALLPSLRRIAMDNPNPRSSHSIPTPRGAGLGVAAGIVGGGMVALLGPWQLSWSFVVALSALTLITAIGFTDDVFSLDSRLRLLCQIVLALTASLLVADELGRSAPVATLGSLSIVAFVNAFNFMDGVNGISGIVGMVHSGWLCLCTWLASGPWEASLVAILTAAALAAFLPYNLPASRVFLGDSGSYCVGFTLSLLSVWIWLAGVDPWMVFAPMTIYFSDIGLALLRKILRRERWDAPHREHVYQQLAQGGLSHAKVSTVVGAFVVLAALGGLLSTYVFLPGILCISVVCALYLSLPYLTSLWSLRA